MRGDRSRYKPSAFKQTILNYTIIMYVLKSLSIRLMTSFVMTEMETIYKEYICGVHPTDDRLLYLFSYKTLTKAQINIFLQNYGTAIMFDRVFYDFERSVMKKEFGFGFLTCLHRVAAMVQHRFNTFHANVHEMIDNDSLLDQIVVCFIDRWKLKYALTSTDYTLFCLLNLDISHDLIDELMSELNIKK